MVIAVFIKQLSVGGAEKQSLLLARELQQLHPTFLIAWSGKEIAPQYKSFIDQYGIKVVFLEGSVSLKFFALWRFFRKEKVTHVFNFLLINNLMGGLAGKLAGVPFIYGGIRNCEIVSSKLLWQKYLHNYISDKTIFNNLTGTENLARQGFKKEKMMVVHNGIDVDGKFHARSDVDQPVIFTAARFLSQKDHYTALRAIKIIKQSDRWVKYVMAGYGPQEGEIRQWIKELGLTECVEINVAPKDLPDLFNRAHIYLSTSLKEGLSNSIMEAMASGLPVVATNVGDNKYLVRDGENGILVDKGNPENLASALIKLLDDPQLRQNMGLKGYEYLKGNFSVQKYLNCYIELLNDE